MTTEILQIKSHPPVGIRMSPEDKALFKLAATAEKKSLATWMKYVARKRVAKLQRRGLLPADVKVGCDDDA